MENKLKERTNKDNVCGNRLIMFLDQEDGHTVHTVPTEVRYGDNFNRQFSLTPVSMMEGDIHTPKNVKYQEYLDRIPKLVKDIQEANRIEDTRERRKEFIRLKTDPVNMNTVEMIFETEENLFMMRMENMMLSALYVLMNNIFIEVDSYNKSIAEIIRPEFENNLSPDRLYVVCRFTNCMNKTELFNKFISHVVMVKHNEFNNHFFDEIIEQSLSKLLVEFADRPIALMYRHIFGVFSRKLLTYCSPNEFNIIMDTVSYQLVRFQSIAYEIVVQLLNDYEYMSDDAMYKYSVYLSKIGMMYLDPSLIN